MSEIKAKIQDIEQKIKKLGGYNCGWTKEDHDEFLKLKTKYRGQLQKP